MTKKTSQAGKGDHYEPSLSIEELARRQKVAPLHQIEELKADFLTPQDSCDAFLSVVREVRQSYSPTPDA